MDPAMLQKQNAAIKSDLAELNAMVEKYFSVFESNPQLSDPSQAGAVAKSHVELMHSVKKMKSTVYGPVNNVLAHFEEFTYSGCLRALLEAGVFETIPLDGSSIPAKELAEKTNIEEQLLIRLMRPLVPTCFEEKEPHVYNQTANSLIYQFPPLRQGFRMMLDEYAPTNYALAAYFKQNGYKEPSSTLNNPYTFAHRTNGLSMWEHISKDPKRLAAFNAAMQAQSAQTVQSYAIFPFQEEYQKVGTTDDTVLLVDIGGGQGQASKAIRKLVGDTKGRIILQDREEVMRDNVEEIEGVEKMTYDFFTPQPVKGAQIYYIRRCLHDWPDNDCVQILSNIAAAMERGTSRLLIAEIVVPPGGADVEAAWMDLTMLMFAGKERSEAQWGELLERSGLSLVRVHLAEGTNFSVVEAVLK
ncbi:O-methyltransferase protein [Rutstroemia sp. NJR-2017a WRK4]|nr:O-methyltransferase protein [Rutstroemia sp. NJR-2017a WRK4]